jgi:hypothetical protein
MAVTTDTFFGNRGTLAVVGTNASPGSVTVGVLKGVEINVTFEHVELYGMGTILRADAQKHSAKVEVSIKFAKFDPTLTSSTFFPYYILNVTGTTTPSGTIEDTNAEKFFTVTANWVGTGGRKVQAAVSNVYFESFPMPMPENDFVVLDLKGYGDGITFTNPA